MKIHEYQAKEILRKHGVPTLDGQLALSPNEAAEAVHTGVANAEAIDRAMRLGVNYPRGPLAWTEAIGLERVRDVLDHLAQAYGEDRYRASWLLRRNALAKRGFHG